MRKAPKGTHRYFTLTRSAISSYKVDDPLETTRNPRSGYFKWDWDVNWGIWMWFISVLLIIIAIVADIILFPFQLIFGKQK
jgi:hypothetical protein